MKAEDKRIRDRLSRARGQLSGIITMLDDGRDCASVVTQLMAVREAVDRAASEMVTAHIDECVRTLPRERAREAVRSGIGLMRLAR